MNKKLLGFKKFKSAKNGNEYCVANVTAPYAEKEKMRGCVGSSVEEIFLPEDKVNFLTPADIGKDIRFDYDIVGGRAYITDVSVVK